MASNEYTNKVVLADGRVLIDLTNDDVTAAHVLSGMKFHLPSGAASTGSCTYDADTSDADAVAAEILYGKTAYKAGSKLTGTMPNRGSQTSYITAADTPVQILNGYHDGSGSVGIAATELEKLIASNIKSGVTILGVEGTYTGETLTAQSKTVPAYLVQQVVLPDNGYDYLSEVTVEAISIVETDNAAGGKTVTIGTAVPAA